MNQPTGVVIISILYFLAAACMLLVGAGLIVGLGVLGMAARQMQMGALLGVIGAFGGAMVLIFGALIAIVGWGLWTLKNWARIVALVLAVIGALGSVSGVVFLTSMHFGALGWTWALLRLGVNVLIIWYLVQPEVKQAFQAA